MKQIDSKYAFPLFTHQGKTGYLSLGRKKNTPKTGGSSPSQPNDNHLGV